MLGDYDGNADVVGEIMKEADSARDDLGDKGVGAEGANCRPIGRVEKGVFLTEYDENGTLARVGFIPNYGNSWLYIYGWLNGGKFMSDYGLTCTLNDPRIVEALVYVTELYDIMGGAQGVNAFQSSHEGADLDPFLFVCQ